MLRKTLTLLFILIAFFVGAQTSDTTFNEDWRKIDLLILQQNLPKTALEKVDALYKKATARQLDAQVIKCLIYRISLEDRVFDYKPNNAIHIVETEIKNTKNPTAACILYSILANRYQQYYHNNRYKFYNRSKTISYKKEDIETWNADDFGNAITENYTKSMAFPKALQQVDLATYDAIILKGNARKLRPTLYDLLVHEALDYFKSGDYYLTKPSYAFELNDIHALAPLKIFLNSPFKTNDTASHLHKGLQLFKELVQFHLNDEDKNALVDVDIERVQWVHNNLANENKDEQYKTTLQSIGHYKVSRAVQAHYLLAKLETNKAGSYQPFGDTTNRLGYVKAVDIIDHALLNYKEQDEGTSSLKNLRKEILQPSINIQTEKVNVPDKPFRILVTYKNVDTLFVRIIKAEGLNKSFFEGRNNDFDALAKQPSFQNFTQLLPQTKDYQTHAVEIKIDALPVGEYLLLTSSGVGFVDSLHKMTQQIIYVSNISYIKNVNDYFALNRETGQPLSNVKVEIYKQQWNAISKKNETIILTQRESDKNGFFNFSPQDNNGNYTFNFIAKNDQLHLREEEYIYNNSNNQEDDEAYDKKEAKDYEEDKAKIFFFTDRSIYRPGQPVYFKGIAITKDYKTKQHKILAGEDSVLIFLQDANNNNIDSLYFKTNDYGSFSGKFLLPQNILTGEFEIKAADFENSSISFNVEEYKRPKFYVEFEKVKGSYRLDDSITVTGTAKAYAGNVIDGAKVAFNIQRNARFVYDWLWRGRTRPQSGNQQISNGEIVADATGKFKIIFKAIADEKVDKKNDPLFDFSISADVTDLNGETRSSSTLVTVGYKSLVLNVGIPKIMEADSLKQFSVTTKNLSSENEPADVSIKVYQLQTPQRLIRKRLWQRADQFVMNKETYINNFPNDDYEDELNESFWATNALLFQATINTAKSSKFNIPHATLPVGYYKIEAITKDKDGHEIKDVKFMQLFSRTSSPYPQYNFNYTINNFVEPTETAQFIAGSMAEKTFVVQQINSPDNTSKTYNYTQHIKGLHMLSYTAKETDRGNVGISEAFVINNRVYTNQYNIIVPFSNKNLQVNYTSFRNKTEPGNKETWTVNIKGNKGEKVAAELLTSMYDASLDQFKQQSWNEPNIWTSRYIQNQFTGHLNFTINTSNENYRYAKPIPTFTTIYDKLLKPTSLNQYANRRALNTGDRNFDEALQGKASGLQVNNELQEVVVVDSVASKKSDMTGSVSSITIRGSGSASASNPLYIIDGIPSDKGTEGLSPNDIASIEILKDASATAIYGARGANGVVIVTTKKGAKHQQEKQAIQPRKNFNETAFFFPNLYADTAGNYTLSFTIPEALTQWKWLSFAHTKDLAFGSNSTTITTQKTLMVQPNAPRFVREGDNMEFVAKISNLSDKELTGQATLELVDATTGTSVDGWFQNIFPSQYFTVAAGQSAAVKFPVQIPFNYNKPLTWRIVATAGEFSDGEENTLPVLTNRMLVTETLPLYLKPGEKEKLFTFDKLLNNKSESLTHEGITVEYTANPIWNVIQSLPYLMEYPYECVEQTFNRFFANALSSSIVSNNPTIKMMFEKWKNDSASLKNNLQKNEELKQILLQETPWVLNAATEEQQKKNIALLFDVVKMSNSMESIIEKLKQMQLPSGGFAWFKGGRENRYMTNYILTGIGKLKKINALPKELDAKLQPIVNNALNFLDDANAVEYNGLKKSKTDLTKNNLYPPQIQYLYMRSFYVDDIKNKEAYIYYYNQAKQFWNKQNSYNAAMIGLALYRNNERRFVNANILPSITENAVEDTAKGTVYWKDRNTCFWYQSPIEHQSMMIDFLGEVQKQDNLVGLLQKIDAAKTWLILNKQTNNWKTTVATADACYALLNAGSKWTSNNQQVKIKLGSLTVNNEKQKTSSEQQETGYLKKRIEGNKVKPSMGNVNVTIEQTNNQTIKQSSPSYGSIYWQYFEDLDKITAAGSPLSINKKIFIERNSNKGKILEIVSDTNQLKVGDKLVVRMELRSDREMEYLHLKDMRASGTEPVNVLSGYKWQDGLGYYEATKDASTNFFIDKIQKGVYIFEYPLYVTHAGIFSVGIATIQCMYAPEFTSHSEGIKITVK